MIPMYRHAANVSVHDKALSCAGWLETRLRTKSDDADNKVKAVFIDAIPWPRAFGLQIYTGIKSDGSASSVDGCRGMTGE